jgi:hypothetical protein
MSLSRKHLSRRTVLRGAGVALALPLLDSMVPAATALSRTAAVPVKRLGVMYAANGMAMHAWRPDGFGELQLAPIQQPLAAFREHTIIVDGLDSKNADAKDTGVHARIQAAWLTGSRPKRTEGPDIHLGISMDQVVAREFGTETQLASIELAMESGDLAGACLPGYSCAYNNTVAWRDATTPLPMEFNPRAVFERLFGTSPNTSPAARRALIQRRQSILDGVTDKVSDLERRIGAGDRAKLDQYLDAVRDVERRLQKAEEQADQELPAFDKPAGVPATFHEHAGMMFDLMVLAYQTDLTRVFAFAMGRELSIRTYPEIGISDGHHPLSHHQDDPEKLAKLAKLQTYQMQSFADFLAKLQATPDGDGTLFDHSLFFYGAGMSNSNLHYMYDLPAMVVAGQDFPIRGGRHLDHTGEPLANLQLAVIDALGVPVESFGDSTGPVDLS